MTPTNWDTKAEVRDEEDLQREDHLRVTSAIADGKQGKQSGRKTRTKIEEWLGFKNELKWINIVGLFFLHMGSLYCIFTQNFFESIATMLWSEYLWGGDSLNLVNVIFRKSTKLDGGKKRVQYSRR